MTATAPSPSSETSNVVWTTGSRLKSSAIRLLSDLRQTASLTASAISSETDPKRLSELSSLLAECQSTLDSCRIEQMLAKASPKQVKAFGAYAKAIEARVFNVVALMGGNQSGKSFCGAAMTAKAIRDDLPPNSIVWSVSPNAELSIKTPQRYLWEFLPHGKIDTPYNPKTGFGVHNPLFIYDRRDKDNPNGRNIVVYFKTQAQYENDPDSFESATVTGIVWVDESIDEKCWNAIQPRIAIHNVPVIVTTIPRMDWMFEAFEEPPPEARVYFDKLLPMDNPAMSADAYARLEMSIASEEERDMRLFGKFMSFGGIVYREFRKEYKPDGHLCRPFKIPDDWPKWRTMDVGMDHPTVCLWCTVAPNGNRYVYREYRSRHTPIVKDAETILAMSGSEHYHSGCLIDASAYYVTKASPKTVAQQYEQAGLKMTPAVRVGRSGVGEWPLIQAVKRNLLNNQLFIFDTCEGLIAEFRKWKFKRNIHGEPVGDDFEDKNNDGLDALKYWIAIGPTFGTPTLEYENTLND